MSITINVTQATGGSFSAAGVTTDSINLTVGGGIGPVGANAALLGGSGIDVTYANGNATLDINATLATLSDVSATAPTAGQVLAWNGTTWAAADDSANPTGYATESYVDLAVANLVDSSPAALDTLNELAAALGDDANFAANVTASLAGKAAANHTHEIANITGLQAALDAKAATASLATVATSGNYTDLAGLPTLGTAAATDATDYATAAQGTLAGSAVQPADLAAVATSGSYADLSGTPTELPPSNLADLADVSGTPTTNQALIYNGTEWQPGDIPAGTTINTLSGDLTLAAGDNVTITTSGSTLTFAAAGGGGGVASLDAGSFPRVGSLLTETGDNITSESGDQLTPEQASSGAVLQVLRSSVASAVPTSLADGELAINTQDGKLFWADAGGTVQSYTLAAASSLDDLTDVDAPTPSSGQVLKWNGTAWAPATDQFGNGTGGGGGYGTALLFG